jgi:hypothetical protein
MQARDDTGMSKKEEEMAFYKLVQDLVNFSMKDPKNYYLLLTLKTF